MEYNYAREKRGFDAEWKRKERWYMKEGTCKRALDN